VRLPTRAAIKLLRQAILLVSYVGLPFVGSGINLRVGPGVYPQSPREESGSRQTRENVIHFLTQANDKLKKHDLDGAIEDRNQAIKLDPTYAVTCYVRGEVKHAKGLQEAALNDFDDAIRLSPKFAPAYIDRAWIKLETFDYDSAVSDCDAALRLDPKIAAAYNNRGVAKRELGEIAGAMNDFNTAIALSSRYAFAYRNRGSTELRKNDDHAAIADFNRAIELNPKDNVAYVVRGQAKLAGDDFNGALADFSRALELNPKASNAYVGRGDLERAKGNLTGAESEYRQAIQIDPKNASAFLQLGIAEENRHGLEEALTAYSRAAELDPPSLRRDYLQFRIWLLRVRLQRGDEANHQLTLYLQGRKQPPLEPWVFKIGNFLLGKSTETDLVESASASDPDRTQEQLCEAWYYAGMKRLLSGDKNRAADAFRHCMETNRTRFVEYVLGKSELASLQDGG
jgi:tetratricopeptide (TPR) repeat protein